MTLKIEKLTKPFKGCKGPHWDVSSQTLYFADLQGQTIKSYKPATNELHSAIIGDGKTTSPFIIPIVGHDQTFLIAVRCNLATILWDGKSCNTSQPEILISVEREENMNQINDTKADALGRIWTGTAMTVQNGSNVVKYEPVGSLFCVTNGQIRKQIDNVKLSNGLTWRSDNKRFYFVDSFQYRIDAYDYDIKTGTISNKRTVIDFKKAEIPGEPDGMTIDTEGNLHIAMFNSGLILRIEPECGTVICKITMPTLLTTSVAFGGKNMDELYVTSANLDSKIFGCKKVDDGITGCLFRITNTGCKGLAPFNVKL